MNNVVALKQNEQVSFSVAGLVMTKSSNKRQRRAYEERVIGAWRKAAEKVGVHAAKYGDTVEMSITSYFSSHANDEGSPCGEKPDADNIATVIMNALKPRNGQRLTGNNFPYVDDCVVSRLISEKLWTSENPGVEITLRFHRHVEPPRPIFNLDGHFIGMQAAA